MYEALLQLVLIHAQTTAVARAFVTRTMQALVQEMVVEALACFKKVQQFGLGGMLQATLEIEFLHRTITQYVTPETESKLQEVYTIISKSYYRQPSSHGSDELQHELAELKKTSVSFFFSIRNTGTHVLNAYTQPGCQLPGQRCSIFVFSVDASTAE